MLYPSSSLSLSELLNWRTFQNELRLAFFDSTLGCDDCILTALPINQFIQFIHRCSWHSSPNPHDLRFWTYVSVLVGSWTFIYNNYRLSVESHIKTICKTIKANLGCFMMIRNCLCLDCAFIWINSMILSHISYVLTTWSPVIS